MASSVTGQPRATMDIDMAVWMGLDDVGNLVNAVTPGYYASETMIRDAVLHRRCVPKPDRPPQPAYSIRDIA
jgi:hypothetical protein